ncbi:MAG: PVC-type heme-binding CxxCH protein [Bacteroidota bacterium]|jgi:putative membrane-bound dehydrogenase-like protein
MKCNSLSLLLFSFVLIGTNSCKTKQALVPGFELADGFNIENIASEPLIKDPVDIAFDDRGNMLVLEMPGYPLEDVQSKVLMLKDTNHDGKMDLAKTYASNLNMATSFMPYEKGILVAAPPYLLYCKDENNDEQVEKVDTLMGGFATGNLQHNYNGLTYGIDNWIYAANGGNDGKPYWWGDNDNSIDLRGKDFRFDIKKKKIEIIGESSGGFGLAMDEFGRIFGTHNLTHASQIVFPDRYIQGKKLLVDHTLQNISDHEENGLARVYPIGEQATRLNHPEQSGYFSGSCGITYYDGGSWGKKYDQTVWVNDVVLNLVHVDKVKQDQSAFKAVRMFKEKEFLATSDRSSRPVNLEVGPDGNMYLIDMYRDVIEHPEWIPDEMEKTLDINAGKDKGRIYKIYPSSNTASTQNISFEDEKNCLNYLSHRNAWYRKTAQRKLIERGISNEGLNALKKMTEENQPISKLHALWILQSVGKLGTDILLKAMLDASAGIRENALIISEDFVHDQTIVDRMIKSLQDQEPRVAMQAALSLSTIQKDKIIKYKELMAQSLYQPADDKWNVAAKTLAVKHFPLEAFKLLVNQKNQSTLLASIALQLNDSASAIENMLVAIKENELGISETKQIIEQLNKGDAVLKSSTVESLLNNLESIDLAIVPEIAKLRSRFKLAPSKLFITYSQQAIKKVNDASMSEEERLKQLSILALLPYKEKSNALFSCLQNNQPLKIQEQALLQLSKYKEKEIGTRVISMWNELSPSTRRYASDLLLYIDTHHDALLTALEKGQINIGEMNFDLERRRMLIAWTDDASIKSRAKKLFSDEEIISRKDVIEKMKPALALKGNPNNGQQVFQAICSNCHKYGNIGQEVGPVLTEINRKSKESIMHDILDPNAAVNTQYISHRVETKDGTIHIGIVDTENDQFVSIKKMGGEKVNINKSDMKKMSSMGTSLMMEGLEGTMSHQEMADLLAFLQKK